MNFNLRTEKEKRLYFDLCELLWILMKRESIYREPCVNPIGNNTSRIDSDHINLLQTLIYVFRHIKSVRCVSGMFNSQFVKAAFSFVAHFCLIYI